MDKIDDLSLKYRVSATLEAKKVTEKSINGYFGKIGKKNWRFIVDILDFGDKSWKQAKMVLWEQKIDNISSIY